MPELPEVTVIAMGLRKALLGKKVSKVKLNPSRIFFSPPEVIAKALKGAMIKKIRRRGKFLLFYLSTDSILLVHLGMTGQLLLYPLPPEDRHLMMELVFSDKSVLVLRDPRRFGKLGLIKAPQDYPTLAKLGPDALAGIKSPEDLLALFRASSMPVKNLLLDQSRISGVGNIYANEALFLAGINPSKTGNNLNLREAALLLKALKSVLKRAVRAGGTTFDGTYVNSGGEAGAFLTHCRVYEREGKECFQCKGLIKKISQTKRSTYYCPVCQK